MKNKERVAELIERAADLILAGKRVVVFTGAGVSTESGIPDFRSPGGLWTKYNPEDFTFQKFLSSREARIKYWQLFCDPTIASAQPNPAHYAVAELYRLGRLDCVITQNIDGLHQKAGLPDEKALELHGTHAYVKCISCGKRYTREEIVVRLEAGDEAPECDDCHGFLKPASISFGQAMPERETREAEMRSRLCDLFIVIGSTLVVYPAAHMPMYAVQAGAKLVIINLSDTPLDEYAEVVIRAKAGEALTALLEQVKIKMQLSSHGP